MTGSLSEMAVLGTHRDCLLLGRAYTQALR